MFYQAAVNLAVRSERQEVDVLAEISFVFDGISFTDLTADLRQMNVFMRHYHVDADWYPHRSIIAKLDGGGMQYFTFDEREIRALLPNRNPRSAQRVWFSLLKRGYDRVCVGSAIVVNRHNEVSPV